MRDSLTQARADLVAALGRAGFMPLLAAEAGRLLNTAHLSVIRFDADLLPAVLFTHSLDCSDTAVRAASVYSRSLIYRQDPLRRAAGEGQDESRPAVSRLAAADIADARHRELIYRQFGLSERFTVLGGSRGVWIALNLYRADGAPPPGPEALSDFIAEAGLFHTLAAKHAELVASAGELPTEARLAELLGRLGAKLTARQIEVCVRALCGLTNAETAADLGIEVSTVATLRRRAYERLEVASLAELYRRCLAAAGA